MADSYQDQIDAIWNDQSLSGAQRDEKIRQFQMTQNKSNAKMAQDMILSGKATYSALTAQQQNAFYNAAVVRGAPVAPGSKYNPASVDTINQSIQEMIQQNQNKNQIPGWMKTALKPIEVLGSSLWWVWSNVVSRPTSFALLEVHSGIQALDNMFGANEDILDAGENWKAAKEFSPAQSLIMAPMTQKQLADRGIDLKNPKMKGFAAEEWFTKGWQKWTTGLLDAAYSFWADPFVIAGKGVGAARRGAYVRPFERTDATIQSLAGGKEMDSLFTRIDKIKSSSKIDGDYSQNLAIDRVREFVPTVKRSAASDALATALVMAEGRSQQALVMRAAMGDTTALTKLNQLDADAARAIEMAGGQRRTMEASYGSQPVAVQNGPWGQMMQARVNQLSDEIKLADSQSQFYSRALEGARGVDKLYFNRLTTPTGITVRQRYGEAVAAKGEYQMGTATKTFFRNFNSRIVRVLRSPGDVTPTSWINLHEADSFKAVKAAYRDLPRGFFGVDDAVMRSSMVGEYVAAPTAMRPMVLKRHEMRIVNEMATRHGVSAQTARDLYRWYDSKRGGLSRAASGSERYSAAPYQGNFTADVIDHTPAGGSIVIEPTLSTQMASRHVMMNFSEMNTLLKVSGKAIQRIVDADPTLMQALRMGVGGARTGRMGVTRMIGDGVDTLGSYWKVAQLARLGYGPRAIGDEFAGQVAALGGIAMLARVGEGLRASAQENMIRLTRGAWQHDKRIAVDLDRALNSARMEEFLSESTRLNDEIRRLDGVSRDPKITRSQRAEAMTAKAKMQSDKDWVDAMHADAREAVEGANGFLRNTGAPGTGLEGKLTRRERQGLRPVQVEGVEGAFAGAFSGTRGAMFRGNLESQTTFAMQMGVDADRAVRRMRGNGWVTITAADGEAQHLSSWLRDLNRQIRHDPLAQRVLMGEDLPQLVRWLRTDAGRQYRSNHAMGKQMSAQELAERVSTHVNHYIDPNIAGADTLRAALLTRDLTGKELKDLIPSPNMRPHVNSEQLEYSMGRGAAAATVSNALDGFYKYMNALPAEFLSRNPLFSQLYRSHINEIGAGMVKNGRTHLSPQEFDQIENAAKRLALRDTKALTFNMDYENRLTHAVRFIYPFMGAQSESWARWARIIADKPQTIAHAGNLYNMPMRMGVATDYNGNPVSPDGYATNTETGERYQVDKTEVLMNVVIPKGLRSSFRKMTGMAATEMQIPLNSFNLVAPDKTWFIPSAGPVVQIPANYLVTGEGPAKWMGIPAQFDKADLFKDMGVLPYGPRDSWGDFVNPATGRRLGDSQDEYSANFQKAMFEIAQEEAWKYQNGNRAYQPDWDEIKKRARQYTTFKMFINFVSPVTVDTANPYDFFRDAYKKMIKEDPKNGEQAFRDKYGDSMWMFAQSLSKNNGGLPSTDAAVRADQQFTKLRDSLQDPSLMKLIAGPYAEGSFSPGAYYYQLNNPVQTGSDVMQREKLTAREAFDKAKADEGWYQYNKVMLSLQNQLIGRGLTSYEDAGAEDLLAKKRALPIVFGTETLADGEQNPYYNPVWRKDFDTIDRGAYERRINDLWKIVNNPVMQAMAREGSRTDISTLTDYLLIREQANKILAQRAAAGGAITITAKKNSDLRDAFQRATNMLIERDTRFGELHNRYLSRDMGYDKTEADEED